MHSTGILRTKSAVVISAILATGLILTGCGGGGDDPKTSMPDVMEPETSMPDVMEPETSMPDVMEPGTGPTDMSDLGEWEIVRANGVPVGNEHTGYDLFARFDARGANPTISASSPMHQPTVAGTWSGKWSARYTALTSDYGDFDETDDGIARINVTITGGNVDAVLTYSGIDVPGLPSSLSSGGASVSDGRFAPSFTVSIPTESGGTVSRTLRGLGQFGGTDQDGVVGYISSQTVEVRSVFYGDRQSDMSDLGEWEVVRANGVPVGNEHTGYDLFARFDARGANPTISASSPMHQPTVAGTWSGKWSARYTALTSDYGDFDETDDGIARINVTITGGNVDAVLTYSGIDVPGLPSSLSSGGASVSDGRFAPSFTVSIPTESGGTVSRTLRGLGQFGGTDQDGVVGYISSQTVEVRSVFYGDRQ